jgi:hypothetical protein
MITPQLALFLECPPVVSFAIFFTAYFMKPVPIKAKAQVQSDAMLQGDLQLGSQKNHRASHDIFQFHTADDIRNESATVDAVMFYKID